MILIILDYFDHFGRCSKINLLGAGTVSLGWAYILGSIMEVIGMRGMSWPTFWAQSWRS